MFKNNMYIFYLIGLGLSISSMSLSMQPIIPSTCTLASTNPVQEFAIAKHLVLHSTAIESYLNNPAFKKESCFHVENTTPQNVLHLIACLKKIDSIAKNNTDTPESSNKRVVAQQALMQYTSSLAINELITLAQNTDYLLIKHKHLTKSIAQALGEKIVATPSDAQSIFQATPDSLHKKVMQALNKQASIDSKLMQSYSELLEPTCHVPLLHPQYGQRLMFEMYNNILKTDTNYRPCYYNPQTQTTIVRSRSKITSKVLDLQITKKNTTQPIIIDIRDLCIDSIYSIVANTDESLFICNALLRNKSFVINLNNHHAPLITGYDNYAFKIDEPTVMYVCSENSFALFDITTNTFHPIVYFPHDNITSMHFNDNQSIVALGSSGTIHIGKKAKNGPYDFTEIDIQFFKNNCTATFDYIRAACLHPNQNKLFVLLGLHRNNYAISCMVDLTSYKTTLLSLSNEIKDVYSNNISFLSDEILYLDSSNYHYFINLSTEHHWSRKQYIYRFLFTTDKSHCLESHSTYSNGRDHEEAKMVPLYNESMSESIALLNKGEFPLFLVDIIKHKPNTYVTLDGDEYQEYTQIKQSALGKILDSIYTITQKNRFSRFCGLLHQYSPSKKNLKGWSAAITCGIIGLVLYYGIDYYDTNKRLDGDDKRNFIKGLFELILFLAKI